MNGRTTTAPRGGRPVRTVLLALGTVLLLIIGLVVLLLAPLLTEPSTYANVSSIERGRDFQDPALMQAAWHLPVAATYAQHVFEFQHNQSFCGPTSAADVLHSLGDTRTQDQMLAGGPSRTWFGYLLGGLTLDQEADLLRRQSHHTVTVLRGLTLDQFRAEMREVNDTNRRFVINFHRGPLFARGHGHFSPLLGYLADRDLVLVGDVNANYKPFLVATARLWQAENTIDESTGKLRGLAVVSLD